MAEKSIINLELQAEAKFESAKSAAKDLTSTLEQIGRGADFDKYWDRAGQSVEKVAEAAKRFQRVQSEANASGLIKSTNAFLASGKEMESLVKSIGEDFKDLFDKAQVKNPSDALIFNKEAMERAQTGFAFLKEAGGDLTNTLRSLHAGQGTQDIIQQFASVQDELDKTKAKLVNTETELSQFKAGDGIRQMTEKLEEAQYKLQNLKDQAKSEFGGFLQANDISSGDSRVQYYFEQIREGTMTAKEAIASLKASYSELFSGDSNIDSNQIEVFLSKLNSIYEKTQEIHEMLSSGKFTSGMFEGASQSAENVSSLSTALKDLANSTSEAESSGAKLDSIVELSRQLSTIASSGDGVWNLARSLKFINSLNDVKISSTIGKNLAGAFNALESGDTSKLRDLANINFDNLQNLKVSSTVSKHLPQMLEPLSGAGIGNLERFAKIDFTSLQQLNGINVSQESANSLATVFESLRQSTGSGASTQVEGLTDLANSLKTVVQEMQTLNSTMSGFTPPAINEGQFQEVAAGAEAATTAVNEMGQAVANVASAGGGGGGGGFEVIKEQMSAVENEGHNFLEVVTEVNEAANIIKQTKTSYKKDTDGDYQENQTVVTLTNNYKTLAQTKKESDAAFNKDVKFDAAIDKSLASIEKYRQALSDIGRQTEDSLIGQSIIDSLNKLDELEQAFLDLRTIFNEEGAGGKNPGFLTVLNQELANSVNGFKNAETAAKNYVKAHQASIKAENEEAKKTIEEAKAAQADPAKTAAEANNRFASVKAQYEAFIRDIKAQQEKLNNISEESFANGNKTAIHEALNEQAEAIKNAFDELNKVDNLDPNKLTNFSTAFKTAKAAVNGFKAAISDAAKEQKKVDNAFKQSEKAIDDARNAIQKYTAARNSKKSGEAYENIDREKRSLEELNQQYKIGQVTQSDYAKAVEQHSKIIKENINTIKDNGDAQGSFLGGIKNSMSRFAMYFGVSRMMMQSVQTIKSMISSSVELNDSLTQLKIVTNETDSTYANFTSTIVDNAKSLGTSVTDLVDATTTFARLGYTLDESSTLASLTGMLQNVGNIDASKAQDSMTSMIKAFDIDIGDVESTMDKLVAVGNGAPISVEQIAEAMTNASSALAAAGNDFDQSVALLTAANTTVQNAYKSSTGLRTIVARLRNTQSELDDLGEAMTTSEYQDIVEALTNITLEDGTKASVSLTDANGELRNTYDIISDISRVWDKMSKNDQSALAETIAGTRQQAVFYSLVEQFNEAEHAMDLMSNSAGVLQSSYDTFLDSTTAHINQFKAAFAGLSSDVFETGFMNDVVDFGTGLVSAADAIVKIVNAIGGLKTVLTGLAGIGIAAFLPQIISGFQGFANIITNIMSSLAGVGEVLGDVIAGTQSFSGAIGALGIGAQGAVLGLTAVVTAGMALYSFLKRREQERSQQIIESGEKARESTKTLTESMQEYKNVAEAYKEGTASADEFAAAQDKIKQALADNGHAVEDASNASDSFASSTSDAASAASEAKGEISSLNDEYKNLSGSISNAYEESVKTNILKSQAGIAESTKNTVKEANKLIRNGFDNKVAERIARTLGEPLTDGFQEKYGLKIAKNIDDVVENYGKIENAINQMQEKGVSKDDKTFQTLSAMYSEYSDLLNDVIPKIDENNQALADAMQFDIDTSKINSVEDFIKLRNKLIKELQNDPYFDSNGSKTAEEYIDSTIAQIDSLNEFSREYERSSRIQSKLNKENAKEIMDWYNTLSDTDKEIVFDLVINTDDIDTYSLDQFKERIDSYIPTTKQLTVTVDTSIERATNVVKSIKAITDAVNSQSTGKGIDIDTYKAEGMSAYSDAIEYNNGVMKYNLDMVNQITQAKAAEEKATLAANKAQDQSRYLENAKQIKDLRDSLSDASSEQKKSINEQISSLLEENSTLAKNCQQYDMLISSINEATSAYQHWLNAQSASQSGEMFDSSLSAIKKIRDTIEDTTSDSYGRIGNQDYKAALDFIVPDSVDSTDQAAVKKYLDSMNKYLTFDDKGEMKGMNIAQFCEDAVKAGLMEIDKASNEYKIAGQKTMQDFADGLGLSLPMVQAMFGEMEEFGGEFSWADEAIQTIGDLGVKAIESSEKLREQVVSDMKKIGDEYNSIVNGNVDYNKRPHVSAETMTSAGWDFDGDVATTFSQGFTIGEGEATFTLDITPIMEDGTVLTPDQLQSYIESLDLTNGIEGVLESDKNKLIIDVQQGEYDPEYWEPLQKKLQDLKDSYEGLYDLSNQNLVLDASGFEDADKAASALKDTIDAMNKIKASPDVDDSKVQEANDVIQFCMAQLQMLQAPVIMSVDASKVSGELGSVISLLQEFQGAQNNVEMLASVGADTSDAQSKLDEITQKIQGLDSDTLISLGLDIDTSSIDSIQQSINNISTEQLISIGVDTSAIDGYTPPDNTATVTYQADTSSLPTSFPTLTRYVNYVATGDVGGSHGVNGTAHAGGTAMAGGNWGTAPGGETLVGELGREIVVDPRTGMWYTVGDNGAEFKDIPPGAIVFNHKQTESLLANKFVAGRASALASGTAMVTGGISISQANKPGAVNNYGNVVAAAASAGAAAASKGNKDDDDDDVIDWIEIAIDRIERAIDNLATIAKSSFRTLKERLEASSKEITTVIDEIDLQQKGYDRYIQEADSVGLSEDLAKLVRDGAIDISKYDKDTQELIKDYQEWYEKALDCKDAVLELTETLGELYTDRFNDVQKDYENQISLLEHLTNTYDESMNYIEERGYLATTKLYEAQKKVQQNSISIMKKELDALVEKMSDAVNSGAVKEGSEQWYEFQQAINDVKEEIQEANTTLLELNNNIRQTKWDHFDYLLDTIQHINEEAEFMTKLLSYSKLFDDKGNMLEKGLATMGLHAESYNVYMAESDRYAKELLAINKEIKKDPYNTILLDRREELLKAQRDSILAAEDEKAAIVDLVREGIDKQLESMKDLIDTYNDSMDRAKDLYDYNKKVKSQAKEVADIQKKLAAYQNDSSEENRATIQKLQVELRDAQEDLAETEYEYYISEQKKMLDDMYDEYETILNARLDDVDALIRDMISTANENSGTICDTLQQAANDVGYKLTEDTASIWENGGLANSILTEYGKSFTSQLTSVNSVLNKIEGYVASMVGVSDAEAEATTSSATSSTETVKPPEPPTPPAPEPEPEKEKDAVTDEMKRGVAAAIWNGTLGWGNNPERARRLVEVFGENNGIQALVNQYVGHGVKASSEYSYKSMRKKLKGYKTGGIVDYTGLAWVDGKKGKPELMLNQADTENFIALKNAMESVANGNSPLSALFGGSNSDIVGQLGKLGIPTTAGTTIGDVSYEINIPIDHVEDYDDFVNRMRSDNQFEKLIQSMTVDRLAGGTRIAKNKYKW